MNKCGEGKAREVSKYCLIIYFFMALNGKMCNIILNGSRLEQVNTFQYLESMITEDAECSKEIRGKLARGQSAETGMKYM